MDGGGEALLVRRSKGKKRPPAAHAERDSGAAGRFHSLMRDYNDLRQVGSALAVFPGSSLVFCSI
jgi:hypothetical protein